MQGCGLQENLVTYTKMKGNKMINIVICDDEKGTCSEIENILLGYAQNNRVLFNIEVFYAGTTLSDYLIRGNKVEILFLDIVLPGMDGIDIGKLIREKMDDEQMVIVYISSNKSYALELFQYRPFNFLIKPIDEKVIISLMDKILRIRRENTTCLEFQNKGVSYRIPFGEILYLQSERRKIKVITIKGTKEYYGKLSEIEKILPPNIFLKIHKSYIVNCRLVEEYAYNQVTMVDGSILSISQAQRSLVRKKILENERYRKNGDRGNTIEYHNKCH